MELGPDLAIVGGLIGEPARAAILAALLDGRALPAGELAFLSKVAPQTASFHLRKLVDASLLTVEKSGKHSYYRLVNERVAAALESLASLAPLRADAGSRPLSERVSALRFARSCYRHLAGALAVEIARSLLDRAYLISDSAGTYAVTEGGREWCLQMGIDLAWSRKNRPVPIRACLDWTERRHHIGGPLGTALFARLVEQRWIVRNPESRAVRLTHAGARQLQQQLGIAIAGSSLTSTAHPAL